MNLLKGTASTLAGSKPTVEQHGLRGWFCGGSACSLQGHFCEVSRVAVQVLKKAGATRVVAC